MRWTALLALCLFATPAAAQLSSDRAGDRIEALSAAASIDGATYACTEDRVWCVQRAAGPTGFAVYYGAGAREKIATIPAPEASDDAQIALWPSLVRFSRSGSARDALIGLVRTQSTGYAGGGASASFLTLYDVHARSRAAPRALLDAPLTGDVSLRACFDDEDRAHRLGACTDEYTYRGTLGLDGERTSAPPRLIYEGRAETFPGPATRHREDDSTTQAPLTRGDIRAVTDETCTFRRVLTRAASGVYEWDAPRPACTDYLEP